MKPINFLHRSLILITALISFQGFSQNLLVNGDFESGSVVGFFSNGAGYTRITPPFSGSTNAGNWALTSNQQPMNTASFINSGDHTETRIYIFDRYGKLMKQISSTGAGWDGTYNGSQMPSDDYWFTVDYADENGVMKQFKAHFTLKR